MVAAAAAIALTACSSGGGGAASTGAASGGNFSTVNKGVLTVSPYSASPPVITISPDGKLGGLIGDLINGFADQNHLTVQITQTTFASSLLYVQQGRSDMTPFIYHTDDRAKTVYYTASQFQLPVAAITKNSFAFNGPDSLKGKKIAAVLGEVWGPYFQKEYGDNVKLYQKDADAAQSLLNGQSDAYINSSLQLLNPPLSSQKDLIANPLKAGDAGMPAEIITNVAYNVVSCKNKGLATAFDTYIQGLATSGQLKQLYEKSGLPANFRITNPTAPSQGC